MVRLKTSLDVQWEGSDTPIASKKLEMQNDILWNLIIYITECGRKASFALNAMSSLVKNRIRKRMKRSSFTIVGCVLDPIIIIAWVNLSSFVQHAKEGHWRNLLEMLIQASSMPRIPTHITKDPEARLEVVEDLLWHHTLLTDHIPLKVFNIYHISWVRVFFS